ncbi:MAG: hypothetical protein GX950_03660 [Candidatus Diapherotrites archaeon]|uniref:Type II secretion system protein n=1 Tax=Candidatus Iainarchaeum sp. TaxID=3101447 RepID=A0A7K4C0N4_9ARCH|nr:hypothetical protein [Candidatus Diapherotrites archaeon]
MKNKKGFVISIEAMISLLVLILVLLSLPQENNTSLKELLITQQENDLLRVWASEQPLINQNDLINDSKKIFGENFTLYLDGKKIYGNQINLQKKENCVSSEGTIIEKITLIEKNIKIIVCE